ncbi:hypothetical protein [Alkaliphilus serpentinus]|uniref:Uncharacterized protein n=1 Tax=Alkaliphilus serpentinus TaxID=1482731 RepID=A0A833HQ64_9FIRM|nr:hypothetical protein [Alkaliphilus serpentinus]KAB3531523.1 hypothetical protein F8153_04935 [Alkaliphilus serpentinus]
MFITIVSLTALMYMFIRLTYSIDGRLMGHRFNYLWAILEYQYFLNRDILYFKAFISLLLTINMLFYFFLSASSNHLILSFDILVMFTLLIILRTKAFKLSKALLAL